MSKIEFTTTEKEAMVRKLQSYFEDELSQDIGQFDAEFLLDFFADNLGAYFYNQGLHDAMSVFQSKMETVGDEIYVIEKDVD